MNPKLRSILLWVFSFLFTVGLAIYQRMTGPTYPVRGNVTIENTKVHFKLIRTFEGMVDAPVHIIAVDTSIHGEIMWRRFRSYDRWTVAKMARHGDTLSAWIPGQSPAGKVMYHITLMKDGTKYLLNEEPTIIRFKGIVPKSILFPHILIIFLAMMLSTRAGLEAIFRGKYAYLYTWLTVVFLFIGGLVLGPVIQKYAFGAYWTGWPFGHDLTDNKSLVAFIFWIIALVALIRNRSRRLWPVIAAFVMLVVFLIPHSVLGSELDYTKANTERSR
jgi:hypothetical protein